MKNKLTTHKEFYKKEIPDNNKCKVIRDKCGNITFKTVMGGNPNPSVIKVSSNEYLNKITGELIQSGRKSINKGDNVRSVINSSTLWHDLISANISDHTKVLRFCLTFEDKTLDLDLIRDLYARFMRKLRRKFVKVFGNIEYMYSPELYKNEDGYHLHGLLFFPVSTKKPFIDYKVFRKIWANGDVDIEECKTRGELFSYILSHSTDSKDEFAEHMNEKFERIKLIPANAKLVRYSRGIKAPIVETISYDEWKSEFGDIKPSFERVYYKDFYYVETDKKFRVWYFYRFYRANDLRKINYKSNINTYKRL